VARAKAQAWDELYDELETPGGAKKLYRLAKTRDKATNDITHIRQIKNGQGLVLTDEDRIKERWTEYFETLLNEENPRIEKFLRRNPKSWTNAKNKP